MRLPRPILEEINFQGVVLRGFFLQLEFFLSFVVCVVVFLLLLLTHERFSNFVGKAQADVPSDAQSEGSYLQLFFLNPKICT